MAFLVVLLCPAKTPRYCSGRRIGNIRRLCSQAGGVWAVIGNGTRASECRDRGRLCEEKALIPNVAGSEKGVGGTSPGCVYTRHLPLNFPTGTVPLGTVATVGARG